MKPRFETLALAALWVGMAAALGWIAEPAKESSDQSRVGVQDPWQLPAIPQRRLEAERMMLAAAAPYWGGSPAAAGSVASVEPPRAATWRLAGVVGQGSGRKVLVVYSPESGKPPALLRLGDRLPTDHIISRIKEKSICVQIGKKSYELALESMETGP